MKKSCDGPKGYTPSAATAATAARVLAQNENFSRARIQKLAKYN
jgi:hypothetical protein